MRNVMEFEGGYRAVITYDPEIEMFRGEFVGLNGEADFYAKDADSLRKEGRISLDVFLRMCAEDGVSPKKVQGKFALRLPPACTKARRLRLPRRGSLSTLLLWMQCGRPWRNSRYGCACRFHQWLMRPP